MAGLPKSIIKKYGITKKAWSVFRGRSRSRSKSKTKTRSVKKTARRRYFRRRRRGGGGKSMTRTAFKMIRIAALVAPGAHEFMIHGNDWKAGLGGAIGLYTGFDLNQGNFDVERLTRGYGPYLLASVATYGIPKIASIFRRL